MKKQVATILISFFWMQALLSGYSLEVNTSYDHFRGLPDGSWNGNDGALIAINSGISVYDCVGLQLGGSYGLYNWNGRGNLVLANPKQIEQIGFVTAGASSSFCNFNGGLVYDRLFTKYFGLYDVSPSVDQLRLQLGYSFCCDEVGIWATHDLTTAHENALGIPVSFRTIGQVNLFWSHLFYNCAKATLWIGTPYRNSLMFSGGRAGTLIAGFSFRAPLTNCLFLDGNGSYMGARRSDGVVQSRNYGSSLCLGLTYIFGGNGCCECCDGTPYMSIANHSNFFVDTDANQ